LFINRKEDEAIKISGLKWELSGKSAYTPETVNTLPVVPRSLLSIDMFRPIGFISGKSLPDADWLITTDPGSLRH